MTGPWPLTLFSRMLLVAVFLGIGPLAAPIRAEPAPLPVSGDPVPELAVLDDVMQDLMQRSGISAGMLAVSRKGKVVFLRAYGWKDKDCSKPLEPTAVMRIASVSKPITAAAVQHLVAKRCLRLDDRVFKVGRSRGGLLDYKPYGKPDPRLGDITVEHLLQHEGGWDDDITGDLSRRERKIAAQLKARSPPGRAATVRWIMGQPLQFDPGSKDVYSNVGYLVLGLVVEEVSGLSLEQYVQKHVFKPLGVDPKQVFLGRTFAEDQDPREPYYDATGRKSDNVFDRVRGQPRRVESPYGGWHHEARVAQGGLVASPLALLAFLKAHSISGDSIGGPRRRPGGWRLTHTGSLRGCTSLARQRGDGIDFAALFNKRTSKGVSYSKQLKARLDEIFDSGAIERWPR